MKHSSSISFKENEYNNIDENKGKNQRQRKTRSVKAVMIVLMKNSFFRLFVKTRQSTKRINYDRLFTIILSVKIYLKTSYFSASVYSIKNHR